ncbi:hypothetical protein GCK72_004360 [Caenorhabditis remanei]|uniref:HMG box domain-containing protein n=1 Tax=Caenorhabditis remanei TaxID=31234 RepID=A0A6A5HDK2_CAERE|nr:hypothetical protein GCK72_004360 [Caenorhabditis remanei]KAF1764412.1 hypothetical protein GCK72_004360 [Caenorhabditis remanei]
MSVKTPTLSPFILFCSATRKSLADRYPTLTATDIQKHLEVVWITMCDEEKRSYQEEYNRILLQSQPNFVDNFGRVKRPRNGFLVYRNAKPYGSSENLAKIWREMTVEDKRPYEEEAKRVNKLHKELHPNYKWNSKKEQGCRNPSKRPPKSYSLFLKAKYNEVMKSAEVKSENEVTKRIKEIWKKTSKEDRQPYIQEAKRLSNEWYKNCTNCDHLKLPSIPQGSSHLQSSFDMMNFEVSQPSAPMDLTLGMTDLTLSSWTSQYPSLSQQ